MAVMVGDTAYDCQAAKACGIPFIGCLYGFRPAEMEAEAKHRVNTPGEIFLWRKNWPLPAKSFNFQKEPKNRACCLG